METLSRLALTFFLNALWQAALVTAIAALGARLLRRSPARYAHALWILALLLTALLPFTTLPNSSRLANQPGLAAGNSGPQPAPLSGDRVSTPRPQAGARSDPAEGLSSDPMRTTLARQVIRFLPWNAIHQHRRAIVLSPVFADAALSILLLSLLCQLTRLARAWTRTRRIRRSARGRELPGGMTALVARCQAALGLKHVCILGSSRVAGPATVGFFMPVIILPESLFHSPAADELTSALCHEMAHIRRRDYLLNLVCEFLSLPLAFHPAAWWLKRRIDETRELACDEAASGRLLSAPVYARSLVNLANALAPPARLPAPRFTLGVFDANILEERIMRLLDQRPWATARRAKLLVGCAAMALGLAAMTAAAFSFTAAENAKAQGTTGNDARAFMGTWRGDFQGKRYLTLTLRKVGERITGSLSPFNVNFDEKGNLAEAEAGTHGGGEIVETIPLNGALRLRCKDEESGEVDEFTMRLVGGDRAEFELVGAPAAPGSAAPRPLVLTRESPAAPAAPNPGQASPGAGVTGGVVGGVPGGKTGGVVGVVVGGVPGGVTIASAPRAEQGTGKVSGTVFDPSGARVPDAVVSLHSDAGFYTRDVTSEVGDFSFTGLPSGRYRLKVVHAGFEDFERSLGAMPDGAVEFNGESLAAGTGAAGPHLTITLDPGRIMQLVEITAKAPQGVVEKRLASAPQRIRVGGQVEAMKLIRQKRPEYPESARQKGMEGEVVLEAVISTQGVPLNLHVLKSPDPALSEAALAAVGEWRYEPTLLNGQPIEVVTTIALRFRLEN